MNERRAWWILPLFLLPFFLLPTDSVRGDSGWSARSKVGWLDRHRVLEDTPPATSPGGLTWWRDNASVRSGPMLSSPFIEASDTVFESWAVHYGSGIAIASYAEAHAVVVDDSGYVYVAGSASDPITWYDLIVIKYDSSGDQKWIATYTSPGYLYDAAGAIAVDNQGRVYVTGMSGGINGGDLVTLRYSRLGDLEWVSTYSGANGDDQGNAIALDSHGNVYVTGASDSLSTYSDYITIKYDTTGVILWTARYDGPALVNGDVAADLTVDDSGNVYVTGVSPGVSTSGDYVTIKYSGAGETEWIARYNGPANGYDIGIDLAMDGRGDIIVTGYGAGNDAIATVKYNSSGDQLWEAVSPGSSAFELAVDYAGNIIVVGYSLEGINVYTTWKYDPDGIEQWRATYRGPGSSHNYCTAVVTDAIGNIYVTGRNSVPNGSSDYATIKYDPSGVEQWVATYDGPGGGGSDLAWDVALDRSANVYVTGYGPGDGSFDDFATVKYANDGEQLWEARYTGVQSSEDYSGFISVDDRGNVHVAGIGYAGSNDFDYTTVKYDSLGTELWVDRYDASYEDDFARDLGLHDDGSVYVTGQSNGDFATVKYDASGSRQWVVTYNGPAGQSDAARSLAVDSAGNVCVTGRSQRAFRADFDYATVKYNSEGVQQWVARYNGLGNTDDRPTDVVVDPEGNTYVTGIGARVGTGDDYLTIKYDPVGNLQWFAEYNGPANGGDTAVAIVVDLFQNVFVTGVSQGSGTQTDYATVKYNPDGSEAWVARYNGPANSIDRASSLGITPSGRIVVAGTSEGIGTGTDYGIVKYSPDGQEELVARYNRVGESADTLASVSVDNFGNVYATGWSIEPGSSETDIITVKYDPQGIQEWVIEYDYPTIDDVSDRAVDLAVDDDGNIYVAGNSQIGDQSLFITIKYEQLPEESPGPVSLLIPPNNAVVSFDSVLIAWSHGARSNDSFQFELSADSLFNKSYVDSTIADTSIVVLNLENDQSYFWRARAHNAAGWGPYGEVWSFTVRVDAPSAPLLSSPPDGALGQPITLHLRWHPAQLGFLRLMKTDVHTVSARGLTVDAATRKESPRLFDGSGSRAGVLPDPIHYRVQISLDPGFAAIVLDDSMLVDTTRQVGPLEQGTTHYWRVNARNVAGTSAWSAVWSFRTDLSLPEPVSLLLPRNGAVVRADSAVFVWRSGNPEVDRYWLEGDEDSLFATPFIDSLLTDTMRTVYYLQNNETYNWRVRAHNSIGWGPFSEVWDFSVIITDVADDEQVPSEFSLSQNYPNPFNPLTVIRYGLPERAHVRLEVFNILGEKIALLVDDEKTAGYHEVILDAERLSTGMYFYRVRANQFVDTKKLVILR